MLVRREIWHLAANGPWDPYTLAYAKAIREMQGRQFPADPTSYDYQAAMHGTDATPGKGPDGVWNMCQHQSWFFLPWHRMYILWFERIVRDIVTAQGGPADWALPYWNWQTNRALRRRFVSRTYPPTPVVAPTRCSSRTAFGSTMGRRWSPRSWIPPRRKPRFPSSAERLAPSGSVAAWSARRRISAPA